MTADKTTIKTSGLDANQSVSRAAQFMGQIHNSRMCEKYAEESVLGHGGVYGSAKDYYNWASGKNSVKTSAPPAGVPVFYAGNSGTGYGHVAVSAGGGYVYSTDVSGNRVGKVKYNELWGGTGSGQYLGWTGAIQKTKGGAATRINYDPKSVGNAPSVNVTKPIPSSTGVKSDKNRGSIFSLSSIGSSIGHALHLPGFNSSTPSSTPPVSALTPTPSPAPETRPRDSNTIGNTNRIISR